MSTKYILIGIAALVIAGGIYAGVTYKAPAANQVTDTTAQTPGAQGTKEGDFTGSLADLIGRGGDWKCTFGSQGQGFSSTGTSYVSGGKLRADFSSKIQQLNQTVDSHMIQDAGFVYVWTSLAPQGFKAKATLGSTDATKQYGAQGVNIDQKYNYNCAPWKADLTLFALPNGVKFVAQ